MNPLDSIGAALFLILGPLTVPIQIVGLLLLTIFQLLTGQPTFCSSPSVCL